MTHLTIISVGTLKEDYLKDAVSEYKKRLSQYARVEEINIKEEAIKNEDSYGYKIIKDIKPYIEMSESTLYTILKRLEESKMLTVRTAEHDGRLRKYYQITKKGRERLEEFKEEWREVMAIYRFITKDGVEDA